MFAILLTELNELIEKVNCRRIYTDK